MADKENSKIRFSVRTIFVLCTLAAVVALGVRAYIHRAPTYSGSRSLQPWKENGKSFHAGFFFQFDQLFKNPNQQRRMQRRTIGYMRMFDSNVSEGPLLPPGLMNVDGKIFLNGNRILPDPEQFKLVLGSGTEYSVVELSPEETERFFRLFEVPFSARGTAGFWEEIRSNHGVQFSHDEGTKIWAEHATEIKGN
ncbi:MAG: hypothetical protein AAF483_05725 [Planctomycetota bacterium]